jgi:signal transduction histidine kinase
MKGTADAYPFRTLSAPLRFAIALGAISVVFLVDRAAGATIDDGSKFLLMSTAVMASAWFAGTGPALAATVLGGVLGAFEVHERPDDNAAIPTHLALFVVQGLLLTAVISELRAARRASDRQAKVAQAARREGEAANRMKDEFLATVSHELRTPLNAVLGWVYLLQTGKLDRETSTRGLDSIDRNVRLQAQLTRDLLDVSRALTGELQVESHPVTLGEAVRQALVTVDSAAKAKGVVLELSIPETPVVVLGDETRLRQIAWHLMTNAIKFTPHGGMVRLIVEGSRGEARLTVTDSGQGIDPEFLPRIFDRFTQADPSPTRAAGGLGVGLALVRELVELHGGEIEARNRPGGAGATFMVRFPLQPVELLGPRTANQVSFVHAVTSPPLDGLRVVVLDHDVEGREVVRTILQQRGATVRAVGDVAEALEALEGWHPDVLVTDSAGPDHDSYTLIGKIHSLDAEHGGRIPALALTTFARTDARLGPMLTEMQRALPKPIEPATLTAEIARLSGRERRLAQR